MKEGWNKGKDKNINIFIRREGNKLLLKFYSKWISWECNVISWNEDVLVEYYSAIKWNEMMFSIAFSSGDCIRTLGYEELNNIVRTDVYQPVIL